MKDAVEIRKAGVNLTPTERAARGMFRKIVLYLCLSAIALPLATFAVCYGLLCSERFVLGYLLPYISEVTGTSITASSASVSPFRRVSVKELRVNCPESTLPCGSTTPFSLSAETLELTYDIAQLFSGTIAITSLRGERVEGSFTNVSNSDESPTTQTTPASSTPTSTDEPSALMISLANTALVNSSFRYAEPSNNSRYIFDAITIDIPTARSHGRSEIKLSTRVTIASDSLNLKDELVSGSLILTDSSFFAPRAISLTLEAGSAKPRPIQLTGSLRFSETPYALQSIHVAKATVRDSLTKALGLPQLPISEFEFEIEGEHQLSGSQPTRASLKARNAVLPTSYNLSGSSLTATFSINDHSIDTSASELSLIANNALAAKLSFTGSVSLDPYRRGSKLTIEGSDIDGDQLARAFSRPSDTPQATAKSASTNQAPENLEHAAALKPSLPKLPLLDAALRFKGVRYQKIELSQLDATLVVPTESTIADAAVHMVTGKSGRLSLFAKGDLNTTVNIQAKGEKINLLPMAALAQKSGDLLEGGVDLLDLDLSFAPTSPRASLTGSARMKVSRCIVPSTLHGQVPFNLLFLPFDALITVFGGTLNAILPKSVSSISDGIRQVLDDAGRLGIEKGEIDLSFDRGDIRCNKVEIDTKNLPDFSMKGRVSSTNKLDFTIFIALLKLNLPLPVAGTLQTPLPDVLYLGPEIVRGLGLSVGNIAGGVMSLVGASGDTPTPPSATE